MKPVNKTRFEKMARRLQDEFSLEKDSIADSLTIHCFGNFEVLQNGVPIVWQRAKAEELFALLVLNANAFVHKDVILESLWPYYERTKSLSILQTSVCKIRNLLSGCKKAVRLTYADGKYGLFLSSDVVCDYLTVRSAVQEFRADNRRSHKEISDACAIFQRGLLLFNGYLWSEKYEGKLRRDLTDCLRLTADSALEEKSIVSGLLSQINRAHDA